LLSAVIVLLLVLLFEVRRLSAKLARSEAQRERREAEERRVSTVRALKVGADADDGPLPVARLDASIDTLEQMAIDFKWQDASRLLERVEAAIESAGSAHASEATAARARLARLLAPPAGSLHRVRARSNEVTTVLSDLNSDGGWTLSTDRDGTRVQYRRTHGHLAVKIDALVDGVRPADALYIWRETSLYAHWFPLLTGARELCELSPAETVVHTVMDNFVAYNDLVMRGYGCDSLRDGFILMVVRPLDSADLPPGVVVPPMARIRRMMPSVRVPAKIDVLVEPLSASSVRFAYALSVPLAPSTPTWVVTMILQHGMAQIFTKMREQAMLMATGDPNSRHLERLRTPEGARTMAWLTQRIDPYVAVLEGRSSAGKGAMQS
jgi:hypothetical protein